MGTDGHIDITKLIVAFLNFVKARNKTQVYTDIKIHKQYVMKMTVQVWKSYTLYRKYIPGLIAVLKPC
jgi:hypothetical protein